MTIATPPSPERSRNMAAIRSRDTKPELFVRRSLHAAGFRYRLHRTDLPGKPDLVFPAYNVAVFVHGCFWHGHVCREAHLPRSNREYWVPKIWRNVQRDHASAKRLQELGWRVVIIRECELPQATENLIRSMQLCNKTKSRTTCLN